MSNFDESQKRRADHAEAMWVGTALGTAEGVKKLNARHKTELAEVEALLSSAIGNQVNIMADRDAHKVLANAIIDELKHPEKVRRFSAPDADIDRGRLLQDTYRQSWEGNVDRIKKDDIKTLSPEAIEASRQKSIKRLREYKDLALAAEKETASKKPGPKP